MKSPKPPGVPFKLGDEEEDTDPESRDLAGALIGDYRLVAKLATGGMSEVWLADAVAGPLSGGPAVVKRLLPALRTAYDVVARFRAEAEVGSRLDHPNLARAFGLIEERGELFLAQELVGGETLALLAAAARLGASRLGPPARGDAGPGPFPGPR